MEKNYILMGLPESGKTTFLAALWHVVYSNEIKDSLHMKMSSKNMEYLNEIKKKWLKFEPVGRNTQHTVNEVNIHIELSNDDSMNLIIPDCSGEIYRDIFETRTIEDDIFQMLNQCDGSLFFINPEIKPSLSILDENRAIGIPDDKDGKSKGKKTKEKKLKASNLKAFKIRDIPTAVILVDLFQIFQRYFVGIKKIAIIISAWDMYLDLKMTPETWLKDTMPLLYQYLKANVNEVNYKIYGVSAQGGDYSIKREMAKLKDSKSPSERIKIQDEKNVTNDISLPLKWLLNHE